MKILRAIGAFFAKIGRWIANTAWVQPLLIVGGIFAIIFSIPYIKKGIEGLATDTTDYKYQWYKDRALTLTEGGRADKLLGYLENYDENASKIKSEFGSKFFLSFVKKGCQGCKDAVEGYKYAINKLSSEVKGFKLYSILVDKTDDDGNYMAKPIYSKHSPFFDKIVEVFGEDSEDYPLYRNLINKGKDDIISSMKSKIGVLNDSATSDEGLDTPLTMLIDLDKEAYGTNGVTEVFFNYIDFDFSSTINAATKAVVVKDMWTYDGLFDQNYEE